LHYVIDQTVLSRGLDRPVVVLVAEGGWLAAPVVALFLWIGAFVAGRIAGARDGLSVLLITGIALGLWATTGGTMDAWLKLANESGGPLSAAYWPLLGEYIFLTVCVLGVAWIGGIAARGPTTDADTAPRPGTGGALAFPTDARGLRTGVLTLLVSSVAAALPMWVLMGPIGNARHGQVFFAVALSFAIAVAVCRHILGVTHPMWYWLAPMLLGMAGVVYAALNPELPPPYDGLGNHPASKWVYPLPIEMVSVGLVATILAYRAGLPHGAKAGK
jgi:hypothetical protein